MRQLTQLNVDTTSSATVNLSPLIDMVFLLLIFFMVTTVFVEETGVDVQRPVAASAVELEKRSILLAITRKGEIVHGGKTIGVNSVRGLVARQLRAGERPVIVVADQAAEAGLLVDVIDECKLAGATRVHIAARPE